MILWKIQLVFCTLVLAFEGKIINVLEIGKNVFDWTRKKYRDSQCFSGLTIDLCIVSTDWHCVNEPEFISFVIM